MFYAGLLAFLYVGLTIYVIRGRFTYRVSLGDGGHPDMEKRIRAHGNFSEFAPLGLILLFLVDYAQYSSFIVHAIGILLVLGRMLHAWGILCGTQGRQAGMAMTLVTLIITGALLIFDFVVFNTAQF